MLDPTFWTDPDFDDIDDPLLLHAYVYLISNGSANSIGCYKLSLRTACNESRIPRTSFLDLLHQLENTVKPSKIMFDESTGWIWVKGMFSRTYKSIPHQNLVTNVVSMLSDLERSDFPFFKEFSEKHKGLIESFQRSFQGLPKHIESLKEKEKEKENREGEGGIAKGGGRKKRTNRVKENSAEMVKIGGWFSRKPETLWSNDEAQRLAGLGDIPSDELDLMAAYYTADIQEADDYRRRDIATLLNNWTGELDRARKWRAQHPGQRRQESQESSQAAEMAAMIEDLGKELATLRFTSPDSEGRFWGKISNHFGDDTEVVRQKIEQMAEAY